MKTLSIDLETFSSEDLSRSGVYRYADAEDFRILLFGYAIDGGPVYVADLARGEKIPEPVMDAIFDPDVQKYAFNAAFERVCLSRYFCDLGILDPGEFLSPSSWRCTMVWCSALGLPQSLAAAGAALGLDRQKMTEGKELIRFFCTPAEPSLVNGGRPWNGPDTDPNRWKTFVEYNRRDVETEMAIQNHLRPLPLPDDVWREYALDQRINDRGIRVDLPFAEKATAMDMRSRAALTEELRSLTELANPNSASQVRSWLMDHGVDMPSLGKKEVIAMLKQAPEEIRPVLFLRQQLSKSSARKYQAMQDCACADGRLRGAFQFYGASRSGRWAGRAVQLQNLPQNHLPDLKAARDLVRGGRDDAINILYGSVPDVLTELIRTAFIPSPGRKFIVSDYSAIEARVIAWLAGESWRTEVFAGGGDIYCASASRMFHVPVEKHGINGHLRQRGKVAELALGYGGGIGALKAMGALEMGVPEEELQGLVDSWREANPNIVRLWWNVDQAVKTAVVTRSKVRLAGLAFALREDRLIITLPSGRFLSYVRPRITPSVWGRTVISFRGVGPTKKWETIESYGPKFVENIVQGIARDVLACAMRALESQGYAIVAHVHDEVIVDAPKEVPVQAVTGLMGCAPAWAPGLKLRAEGYECEFYQKDS